MNSNTSKWIEHLVKCELYGNKTKERIVELLRDVYSRIINEIKKSHYISTKAEYTKILKHIEELLNKYSDEYKGILSSNIVDISNIESEWIKDFMSELGKDFIIPASLISTIKFSPVATSTNYEQLVDSSIYRIKNTIDNSLRTAYLVKEKTSDTASRLSNKINKEIINTTSDVEVFNTTAFSMTDYLMFRTNKEKVRYTAILDSKTCIACGELDGTEYEMKYAPVLPMHYNCRCSLVPIELGEIPSYSEWFEEQPDEVKKQILGKTRYELYMEKGVKISEFVNNGQIIPLSELKLDKTH